MKRRSFGALALLLFGLAGPALGCNREPASDEALHVPDRASFPLVAGALEHRCATLDCHGMEERNLRLYTGSGLRLAPEDVPGSGETTDAENEASYQSVVGLEPEAMSLVVGEQGKGPERLTLIRKARGAEPHKGGAVIRRGEDADRCITSWLSTTVDEEACARAQELIPPW